MIRLISNKKLKQKYKNLLKSQWTKETVYSVLELLNQFLSKNHLNFNRLIPDDRSEAIQTLQHLIDGYLKDYLNTYIAAINEPRFSPIFDPFPHRRVVPKVGFSFFNVEIIYYLTFPLMVERKSQEELHLEGEIGFLRDIQSLLFLTTVHHFLPELNSKKMKKEHDLLLNVLHNHCYTTWTNNPSHQYYLLSALFEYLGESDDALKYSKLSFSMTDLYSYDYLVKAQDYWSLLVKKGLIDQGRKFLISLIRICLPEHLPEVEEILHLHYEMEFTLAQTT